MPLPGLIAGKPLFRAARPLFAERCAVVLATVLVVASCSSPPTAVVETPRAATPTGEVPTRGGRVIDSGFEDVRGLDPIHVQDATSLNVVSKIYDTLVTIDPRTGEVKPWLGSWTISADGLTYSWTIDPGATWSDGRPIVAADFATRVKLQARSRTTPSRSTFMEIDGFAEYAAGRATDIAGLKPDGADPKRFTATLTRAFCPALTAVFGAAPMPSHVFGGYISGADAGRTADEAPENNAPPVASGPFRFKEWRKGDQVTLVRNDAYFKGAPYLDEYVYKVVADPTVQAAQLKTGELSVGLVRPADVSALAKETRLRLYRWPDNSYTFIAWVGNDPAAGVLRDRRVRQALWHAIDVDAVIQEALLGEGRRQVQHHPAGTWPAAPPDQLDAYGYDPARAEQLLRDAGYSKGSDGIYARDGRAVAFSIVTNSGNKERETFLRVATEQLARIGVRVTGRTEPYEILVPKLTSAAPDLGAVIAGWQLGADPDPFTVWHSSAAASLRKAGNNIVGYANPEVDRLIDLGRNGPDCTQAARQRVYQQMNRILNADAPYLFGYASNRILAADVRIEGITVGPFSPNGTANIHQWWIRR